MSDKLGPYITKLMTTVIDKEQEDFVKELAFGELKRLNVNIEEFLRKNLKIENTKTLIILIISQSYLA